jgi:hypothetical protein
LLHFRLTPMKLIYPKHRLSPWPTEAATRDRSNRLLDPATMFIERAFSRVKKRNDSIKFLGGKRRSQLGSHRLQSPREFCQFVSESVWHRIVRKNDSQRLERAPITPPIEERHHILVKFRRCHK